MSRRVSAWGDDPIAEFVRGMVYGGRRPPLAWVVAWAPDGDLRRAWDASNDYEAMVALATAGAGDRAAIRAAQRQIRARTERAVRRAVCHWDYARRALTPPTLAWVLDNMDRVSDALDETLPF